MTPETKQPLYIECPFCSGLVEPKLGKMRCSECKARFQWDDRLGCVFVDLDDLRLPVSGTVCSRCGLLQSEENKKCAHCGRDLCGTLQ
jgi:hypothetical protein